MQYKRDVARQSIVDCQRRLQGEAGVENIVALVPDRPFLLVANTLGDSLLVLHLRTYAAERTAPCCTGCRRSCDSSAAARHSAAYS